MDIIEIIRSAKHIEGITLSGGDPLVQCDAAAEIASAAKAMGLSVWCYTGWQKIDNKWYYFASGGAMVTGTQTINGKVYPKVTPDQVGKIIDEYRKAEAEA